MLAVVMSFGLAAHYFNDQSAIDQCLDQGGSFNYQTDFCSFKENYQDSQSFVANHIPLFLLWLFSAVAAIGSLVLGIVKTPVEFEQSLKRKLAMPDEKADSKVKKRLLMIDNYDSFTYNLVQYFGEVGLEMAQGSYQQTALEIIVKRNDEVTIEQIEALDPDYIVISPGPCTPYESGLSLEVIAHFGSKKPIFGVCLGHQAMAQAYGGEVRKAEKVMHGKASDIYHTGKGVFTGLPNPFKATRYHSLIVKADTLPSEFEVTAWTQDDTGELEYIMGIRHKQLAMQGVQFHPESILSEYGHQILRNFLNG